VNLTFSSLGHFADHELHGRRVEIEGWPHPFSLEPEPRYFALTDEAPCCWSCLPGDPSRRIEVFALRPIKIAAGPLRLCGELRCLAEDVAGWRFQLIDARVVEAPSLGRSSFTRRRALVGSLACVAVGAAPAFAATDVVSDADARQALIGAPTVDVHSHAGGIIGFGLVQKGGPLSPIADSMREGGMAVACLAAVADSPLTRFTPDRRLRAFRDPAAGELYDYAQLSFRRIHDLAAQDGLPIISSAAELAEARSGRPSIIVTSEGADFLEGQVDRVDEAYQRWRLRHLQLTHYRVNELGDIQTETPVHGGLTDFGAEVIRRCNRLGLVVDIAHGTYDLVKRAADVTAKPLLLSHTSLSNAPRPLSRLISPDHARVVAATRGVIGVWPPVTIFADMTALAGGIARMVDIVGVDHVALGSDMEGLFGPSAFPSYRELPALSAALLGRGFQAEDVRKLLGGNYVRVFTESMA
jgi:membrane dipeptidase